MNGRSFPGGALLVLWGQSLPAPPCLASTIEAFCEKSLATPVQVFQAVGATSARALRLTAESAISEGGKRTAL